MSQFMGSEEDEQTFSVLEISEYAVKPLSTESKTISESFQTKLWIRINKLLSAILPVVDQKLDQMVRRIDLSLPGTPNMNPN